MMLKGSWLVEEDSRPADVFKCFLKSHQRSGPLNDNIDCPDSDDDMMKEIHHISDPWNSNVPGLISCVLIENTIQGQEVSYNYS